MSLSRREFVKMALLAAFAPGALAACARKTKETPLGPDPRVTNLSPDKESEPFNPQKTPFGAVPRWAIEDEKILHDEQGRPLIEGTIIPSVVSSTGTSVCVFTIYAEPVCEQDILKARTIAKVNTEEEARLISHQIRVSIQFAKNKNKTLAAQEKKIDALAEKAVEQAEVRKAEDLLSKINAFSRPVNVGSTAVPQQIVP